MAWNRERPHSFHEAISVARTMLSASAELVTKGSIETEAEQLVIAAYRMEGGKPLSRTELFTRIQDRYPDAAAQRLMILAGARAEGKPLQHLTGYQFFLNHEYRVGPDVLVPRPETEYMVSLAIERLKRPLPFASAPLLGLEVGLGSGAISIELLSEFSGLEMIASELTPEATARARENAEKILGPTAPRPRLRITAPKTPVDVLEPLAEALGSRKADFLISNPPYLTATDPIEAEVSRHEPAAALFAPASDALHFYRQIASHAAQYLVPHGQIFLEIAAERATETLSLFVESGWHAELIQDLTGRNRVLFASFEGKR